MTPAERAAMSGVLKTCTRRNQRKVQAELSRPRRGAADSSRPQLLLVAPPKADTRRPLGAVYDHLANSPRRTARRPHLSVRSSGCAKRGGVYVAPLKGREGDHAQNGAHLRR